MAIFLLVVQKSIMLIISIKGVQRINLHLCRLICQHIIPADLREPVIFQESLEKPAWLLFDRLLFMDEGDPLKLRERFADVPRKRRKQGRLLSAGVLRTTERHNKKRFHLVIGESALLLIEWLIKF